MHFIGRLNAGESDLYDGFSGTIKALQEAGKTVSLLGDVPRFNQDPGFCVYFDPSKNSSLSCYLSINEVRAQKLFYRPILKQLSKDYGISYFDIDEPLCSESKCGMINKESVLYRDRGHLNIIGSTLVGIHLAEKLDSVVHKVTP